MNKNDIIKEMLKFWDEQGENAFNFPSIDFWYKDSSYIKMFINEREIDGIPFAGVVVAYSSMEESIETPTFIPSLRKTSLKSDLNSILTNFISQGINIEKELERVGYVI